MGGVGTAVGSHEGFRLKKRVVRHPPIKVGTAVGSHEGFRLTQRPLCLICNPSSERPSAPMRDLDRIVRLHRLRRSKSERPSAPMRDSDKILPQYEGKKPQVGTAVGSHEGFRLIVTYGTPHGQTSERPSAPMRDLDHSTRFLDSNSSQLSRNGSLFLRGVASVRYTAYNVLEVIR